MYASASDREILKKTKMSGELPKSHSKFVDKSLHAQLGSANCWNNNVCSTWYLVMCNNNVQVQFAHTNIGHMNRVEYLNETQLNCFSVISYYFSDLQLYASKCRFHGICLDEMHCKLGHVYRSFRILFHIVWYILLIYQVESLSAFYILT